MSFRSFRLPDLTVVVCRSNHSLPRLTVVVCRSNHSLPRLTAVVCRFSHSISPSDGGCVSFQSFQTISLRHTLTAFVLLAVGVVASVLLLGAELLYRRGACRLLVEVLPQQRSAPGQRTLSAPTAAAEASQPTPSRRRRRRCQVSAGHFRPAWQETELATTGRPESRD